MAQKKRRFSFIEVVATLLIISLLPTFFFFRTPYQTIAAQKKALQEFQRTCQSFCDLTHVQPYFQLRKNRLEACDLHGTVFASVTFFHVDTVQLQSHAHKPSTIIIQWKKAPPYQTQLDTLLVP